MKYKGTDGQKKTQYHNPESTLHIFSYEEDFAPVIEISQTQANCRYCFSDAGELRKVIKDLKKLLGKYENFNS